MASLINQAVNLVRQARYDQGLALLEQAKQDREQIDEALGHRAWILRSLGRYEDSLNEYAELVKRTPEDMQAGVLMAETQLLAGQAREALTRAIDLLRRDPMNAIAGRVVVQAQQALGSSAHDRPYALPTGMPGRPLNPVIDQLESDPASFPTSIYPEIGRFLYIAARLLRPRIVIETGCFIGYSTLCLAQALEENGRGRIHSFDLFEERPDYTSPVIGPCADSLAVARAHLAQAGLAGRVTFHKGDSSTGIRERLGGETGAVDLAFIDGDHTLRGCLKDWGAVDERLAEGGVILLHDTMPDHCQWLGPRYLLEKLGQRVGGHYHAINLPTADGCGLGIIQKKAAGRAPRWRPSVLELVAQRLFHTTRL